MTRRRIAALTLLLLTASTLTACATGAPMSDPGSTRPPFFTTTPGPLPSPGAPSGIPAELSGERWDAIVADLASRGITSEATVVSAEAVTWPDGSLGCPKPGQAYTQAEVPGIRVVVQASDMRFDYRFGRGGIPKLCTG